MQKRYIIALTSGLGNQMSQYALYIYLKQKGVDVKLFCYQKYLKEHNGLEIFNIFKTIKIEKQSLITKLYAEFYIFLTRIIHITKFNLVTKFLELLPKIILVPQWDSYLFVKEIENILIKNIFVFPVFSDENNIKLIKIIKLKNSVSIHIRRNDYINNPHWRRSHGDICDIDYYEKSINYIRENVISPFFVVFSDDTIWARKNLKSDDIIFVNWNKGDESYRDMQLMSLCKHNIIANSSFSWWSACLNQNKEKIVIAPSKWLNSKEQPTVKKFVFPDWIVINNSRPNLSLIIKNHIDTKILNDILRQTYSDFEILMPLDNNKIKDSRIKELSINEPLGNHKFLINNKELIFFKNKRYLSHKLLHYFQVLSNNDSCY